ERLYAGYGRAGRYLHAAKIKFKKNPAKQDSTPAAGRVSDILPFRRSAILAERFYRIETKFPIR
ncbi:hypothetical protein, partial [Gallintestinimicrobium sp.]|uniref:hypothetical protein n=1 Tax=Gallintestinimicrobium sp. TaxID=2981655 RepID=UPI00307E1DEE